jgi:hypothetical protein
MSNGCPLSRTLDELGTSTVAAVVTIKMGQMEHCSLLWEDTAWDVCETEKRTGENL